MCGGGGSHIRIVSVVLLGKFRIRSDTVRRQVLGCH